MTLLKLVSVIKSIPECPIWSWECGADLLVVDGYEVIDDDVWKRLAFTERFCQRLEGINRVGAKVKLGNGQRECIGHLTCPGHHARNLAIGIAQISNGGIYTPFAAYLQRRSRKGPGRGAAHTATVTVASLIVHAGFSFAEHPRLSMRPAEKDPAQYFGTLDNHRSPECE